MTSVVRGRKLYPLSQGRTRSAPAAIESNRKPLPLQEFFYSLAGLPSIPAPPAGGECTIARGARTTVLATYSRPATARRFGINGPDRVGLAAAASVRIQSA